MIYIGFILRVFDFEKGFKMVDIGKNIKRLRQERGITQADLASALGVTCQAVSKWETSSNAPDIALIPKIAALLDVSISELFEEKSG